MANSFFQTSVLPAVCIASALFSAAAVPFAMHKSEVVKLQVQDQPVLSAELRDLATPYLVGAGLVSAAIGTGFMGIAGWRKAASLKQQSEAEVASLQQEMLLHKAELEALKYSQPRLRSQNLDAFLEPDTNPSLPGRVSQSQVMPMHRVNGYANPAASSLEDQPAAPAANPGTPDTAPTQNNVKEKAWIALTAAQTYASYNRAVATPATPEPMPAEPAAAGAEQLDQLLAQIQTLSSQVEELRSGQWRAAA